MPRITRMIFLTCVIFLLWAPKSNAARASFNCAAASSQAEILICSNEELSRLDVALQTTFSARRDALDPSQRRGLVEEQRRWLHDRLTECKIPAHGSIAVGDQAAAVKCFQRMYTLRLADLARPVETAVPPAPIAESPDLDIARTIWNDVATDQSDDDPIAASLKQCTDNAATTLMEGACVVRASDSYEKIMLAVYAEALKESDAETRNAIIKTQTQWNLFRNLEHNSQEKYVKSTEYHSIIRTALPLQEVNSIKERIAELVFYLGYDQ